MRKSYVRPTMDVELFRTNEYVAACGDQNKVYKFTCDAGNKVHGDVYLETNGRNGLQTSLLFGDEYLGGYKSCGITHEASVTDEFLAGYYVSKGKTTNVIVWRGPDGKNIHCTTKLNINEWETDKS